MYNIYKNVRFGPNYWYNMYNMLWLYNYNMYNMLWLINYNMYNMLWSYITITYIVCYVHGIHSLPPITKFPFHDPISVQGSALWPSESFLRLGESIRCIDRSIYTTSNRCPAEHCIRSVHYIEHVDVAMRGAWTMKRKHHCIVFNAWCNATHSHSHERRRSIPIRSLSLAGYS